MKQLMKGGIDPKFSVGAVQQSKHQKRRPHSDSPVGYPLSDTSRQRRRPVLFPSLSLSLSPFAKPATHQAIRTEALNSRTQSFTHPISYPINTSVLLPSHPLVPAAVTMNLEVGSTYN